MTTTTYDYVDGGKEGATTTIVTTDSQTSAVLMTEEHVFHGWGPHPTDADDPDMWKVGLETASTVVLKDDAGEDLQTVITAREWQQSDSDEFSTDLRWSSAWDACGGTRRSGYQKYVKPTSVTRVVKRHDSVPDDPPPPPPEPASYTTVTSNFDDWGNPGLSIESSTDGLTRITNLTYWHSTTNNQHVGFVKGRDVDPGGMECRQYDSLGRLEHTFTNPQIDDVLVCAETGFRGLHLTGVPPRPVGGLSVEARWVACSSRRNRWHGPGSTVGDEILVAHGFVRYSEFEHSVEEHSTTARATAVEAEGEFVEVACEVRAVNRALVGPKEPPLGQRSYTVNRG